MKTKNRPFLESLRRFSDAQLLQICEVAYKAIHDEQERWEYKLDTDLSRVGSKLFKFMEGK